MCWWCSRASKCEERWFILISRLKFMLQLQNSRHWETVLLGQILKWFQAPLSENIYLSNPLTFFYYILEAGQNSLIQVMPAFLHHENKLQLTVRAAYCIPFNKETYDPPIWALCMVHKNSTWNCLEGQESETVLALTKDSKNFGLWPLIWVILPLCCWSLRCLLCGWGEPIALFWDLLNGMSQWSRQQTSRLPFPLSVYKGSGLNIVVKNPLCVWKSDVSSWFFYIFFLICRSWSVRLLQLEKTVMLWLSELIGLHQC